jgi:hypothetical protein
MDNPADIGPCSYDCLLNRVCIDCASVEAGVVGETIDATLIPPDVGELRGCEIRLVVIGEGVLSVTDDW